MEEALIMALQGGVLLSKEKQIARDGIQTLIPIAK
jgi:hypothetical protein